MQFIDVKKDFAFQQIFGSEESKDILISFLNAILDFGDNPIVDLTIINPYQIQLVGVHCYFPAHTFNSQYNETSFTKRVRNEVQRS